MVKHGLSEGRRQHGAVLAHGADERRGWHCRCWGFHVGREAVWADFEDASLPRVAVEHVDGPAGVLCGREEDGAIAARAVVGPEGDICAEDCARLAEEVLDILPTDAVGQLERPSLSAGLRGGVEWAGHTFPTKSCVRVSRRGPVRPSEVGRVEVASWMMASMSSSVGRGRGLVGSEPGDTDAGRDIS